MYQCMCLCMYVCMYLSMYVCMYLCVLRAWLTLTSPMQVDLDAGFSYKGGDTRPTRTPAVQSLWRQKKSAGAMPSAKARPQPHKRKRKVCQGGR